MHWRKDALSKLWRIKRIKVRDGEFMEEKEKKRKQRRVLLAGQLICPGFSWPFIWVAHEIKKVLMTHIRTTVGCMPTLSLSHSHHTCCLKRTPSCCSVIIPIRHENDLVMEVCWLTCSRPLLSNDKAASESSSVWLHWTCFALQYSLRLHTSWASNVFMRRHHRSICSLTEPLLHGEIMTSEAHLVSYD